MSDIILNSTNEIEISYDQFIQNILISRGRFACSDQYHERHHIIPKCMNGTNDIENLIDLFPREHFIAHKLLAKENPDNTKLIHSWTFMSRIYKNGRYYQITAAEYEEARLAYIKLMKGKPLSAEHKRKIGDATRGHTMTKEGRKIIAQANSNRIWSQKSRQKLSTTISGENHPLYGTHASPETCLKMSNSHKGIQAGTKNPRALPILQFNKQYELIKLWPYVKLAANNLHISYSDISRCALGRLLSAGGFKWRYINDVPTRDGGISPGAISLKLISPQEAQNLLLSLEKDYIKERKDETI